MECGGKSGGGCAACEGTGLVRDPAAADATEMPAGLWAEVGEFVAAYAAIKRLGVDGWIAMGGAGPLGPDPDLLARVVSFDAELDRLEFEDEVADAMAEAGRKR